tara:strand:- start:1648 stop:1824 length:177 start_codon:yes stop_codon:yes gene_type:complete
MAVLPIRHLYPYGVCVCAALSLRDDHGNVVVKAFFNHVCYINCRLGPVFICPMAKVPG